MKRLCADKSPMAVAGDQAQQAVKAQPERNQINRGFPSSRAFVET
jgi:hypothetical protein